MRRLSLLTKFGVTSMLLLGALGVVLGHTLGDVITRRAFVDASKAVGLATSLGIQPLIAPSDLRGLSPERLRAVDDALAGPLASGQVTRVKVYNAGGTIVYSDDHDQIGDEHADSVGLQVALGGEIAAKIEDGHEGGIGQLLEVYVPLRLHQGQDAVGAFEVYLPYDPIAASVAADRRMLYGVLVGGLALLYLGLFRLVAGASRTLRLQAAENERQALHDALTGLPNRTLFHDRLEQAILQARRDGSSLAVMLMDLDGFKEINDTLGHHHGDLLLEQIGPRLGARLRASDVVARLGGDEFAVLLRGVEGADHARRIAAELLATLQEPICVEGLALDVRGSIGIALFPEHGEGADSLLRRADVAMYDAKAAHTGSELYAPERDPHSTQRLTLAGELREALRSRQLVLHYQPKADAATATVTGVEALVRWQHPRLGLLPPDRFLPLAEPTELIHPLTRYVLDAALEQCARWRHDGLDLTVSVNLSARNLHDLRFPDEVGQLLERHRLPPSALVLEITESTLMADPRRARDVLDRLSALGILTSIDDFGTGYSSLAYLQQLPVDELKIDRSFVSRLTEGPGETAIVRYSIELARSLGLRVVAEGVEDVRAWSELAALGCDDIQGHYLGRPMPAADIADWIKRSVPDIPSRPPQPPATPLGVR